MGALSLPAAAALVRDPGLTAALAAQWSRRGERPEPVSVTDLVDLRPAYYRRFAPVPDTPEGEARKESGRWAHGEIERLLAPPRDREVRLEREGIVSRLDVLGETPTEIKWTAEPPSDADLLARRPTYFDQLGMYCALAGRPTGKLVVVSGTADRPPSARVYVCEFPALDRIWDGMQQRARLLRSAWIAGDPTGLPRCSWFGHGCEFQDAKRCACRGDEPPPPSPAHAQLGPWSADEAASQGLLESITLARGTAPLGFRIEQYRDVLYPRRAFFVRTSPPGAFPPPAPFPAPTPGEPSFSAVRAAVESLDGHWTREEAIGGEPEEPVPCRDRYPVLVKLSRARRVIPDAEIPTRQPQYVLELGLRAAAVGAAEGRLFLVYGNVAPADSVRVYALRFDPLAPWRAELERRMESLRTALRSGDPTGLPGCPRWMAESCLYASACGGVTGCAGVSTGK